MYGALWAVLPGPLAVRLVLVVLLIAAVVAVCFLWLFPVLEPYVPFNQQIVEEPAP